jgi:hypothetical protein
VAGPFNENGIPKIVFYAKLDGKKKVERPNLRCLDDVQNG